MALTQTTAASAFSATDQFLNVTSATGFAAGNFVRVDSEFMLIPPGYVSGTPIPVYRRGDQGSRQVAHNALAIVVTGLLSDITAMSTYEVTTQNPWEPDLVTMSVNGAIAIPNRDTTVLLDKAGVAAMTLAAPTKDLDNNFKLLVTSNTAQAHTVTATGLFSTGTASVNLATFAAQKGSGFVVVPMQGLWNVVSSVGITFS